jgi:two-component system sensor histidine kinase VicK
MSESEKPSSYLIYIQGGGEMGELIRAYDWSRTSPGTPENWPLALKISIGMVLSSPFPMHITWGKEFIQLYNDAYRPILGTSKHPHALGSPIMDSFPEIWSTIGPMFEGVMQGKAVRYPDFKLFLNRNGYMEECYFDFAYSPIIDENGDISGVLTNVIETTEKIHSRNKIYETLNKLAEREARLRYMLADAPVSIAVLKGKDFVVETVNAKMLEAWGKTIEIIGKPLLQAIPELAGQEFLTILEKVYTEGQPYYGKESRAMLEHNNKMQEVFFTYVYHPLKNDKNKTTSIMVVANVVTEQIKARQQVENSAARFQSLINAIPQIAWTNKPDGEVDFYNQRWYDYTGLNFEQTRAWGWKTVIQPDDLEYNLISYQTILNSNKEGKFEVREKRADGDYRWHLINLQPVF